MKRIVFALFAAFIATLFIITSFAHSGRTDSQGGHYNHSTGEYHYHHGYPPHDHYDTDGDGIKDYCQYGYYDNNNHNQGVVATTKKDAPDKDASDTFDIKKFIGALFGSLLTSFITTALILLFIASIFKKHTDNMSDKTATKVYWVVYILTTILIASIIYNA